MSPPDALPNVSILFGNGRSITGGQIGWLPEQISSLDLTHCKAFWDNGCPFVNVLGLIALQGIALKPVTVRVELGQRPSRKLGRKSELTRVIHIKEFQSQPWAVLNEIHLEYKGL